MFEPTLRIAQDMAGGIHIRQAWHGRDRLLAAAIYCPPATRLRAGSCQIALRKELQVPGGSPDEAARLNGNKVRAAGAIIVPAVQGLGCPRNGKHIGIHPGSGRRAIDAGASH